MSAVPARRRPAKREEADDAEVGPWPRDVSREPEMKISEVVDRLKTEFPALSLSKVRYLEGEGLISPYRVGNGYRRYSKADVERLRYALTAQRDEYLPLSVIRQRLAELDASPQAPEPAPIPRVVAAGGHAVIGTSLDAESLAHHAGASMAQLEELVVIGVVAPDAHGRFDARALGTVSLALRAHRLGIPLRNLRAVRTARPTLSTRLFDTSECVQARPRRMPPLSLPAYLPSCTGRCCIRRSRRWADACARVRN